MTTFTVIGADYWASYLVNGDASGMTDEEIVLCDAWREREVECGDIVECGEPYFSWHYTMHTGDVRSTGGNVCEYTVNCASGKTARLSSVFPRTAALNAKLLQSHPTKPAIGVTTMSMIFSNLGEACVWLYTQGYRQNDAGEWLKGKKIADIRHSPANDGVVCIVVKNNRK